MVQEAVSQFIQFGTGFSRHKTCGSFIYPHFYILMLYVSFTCALYHHGSIAPSGNLPFERT